MKIGAPSEDLWPAAAPRLLKKVPRVQQIAHAQYNFLRVQSLGQEVVSSEDQSSIARDLG